MVIIHRVHTPSPWNSPKGQLTTASDLVKKLKRRKTRKGRVYGEGGKEDEPAGAVKNSSNMERT